MNSTFHPHKLLPSEADKLEGRYDLLTFEEFTPGSEIVVCKECKTIQLFEDTWCADQDNPCCIKCRCNETVRFDLSIFTGNTHVSINHQGKSKKAKLKLVPLQIIMVLLIAYFKQSVILICLIRYLILVKLLLFLDV